MIIYALASLRNEGAPELLTYLGSGSDDPSYPSVSAHAHHCSRLLKTLIDRCLAFDPANRPTFEAILTEVDRAISLGRTNGKERVSRAMVADDDLDRIVGKEDEYAIGLAREVLVAAAEAAAEAAAAAADAETR